MKSVVEKNEIKKTKPMGFSLVCVSRKILTETFCGYRNDIMLSQ